MNKLSLALLGLWLQESLGNSMMNLVGQQTALEKERFWAEKVAAGELPKWDTKGCSGRLHRCNNTRGEKGFVDVEGELYPCQDVDLQSLIPISDLIINNTFTGVLSVKATDLWGWESMRTRQHFTIQCMDNGVWFIENTNPYKPKRLGYASFGAISGTWCDVKVYKNVAYVVKDRTSETNFSMNYGIQVWNMTRFEELVDLEEPIEVFPDYVYDAFGESHNLVVDTEAGYLYSVGQRTCEAGLHVLNLEPNPLRPQFEGCIDGDGYTHDAQCLIYDGPDERFHEREICFAFNEDTLTIWDVTEKLAPLQISRTTYDTASYTHQGWLTEDMNYLIMNDEGDERAQTVINTTTYIVDVRNLSNPLYVNVFDHQEISIDHNLYIWGAIHKRGWGGSPAYDRRTWKHRKISSRYAYLSNNLAGLKILDLDTLPEAKQAGFFDVAPDQNGNLFLGTWSNYMHPSGSLATSCRERGLFFLRPRMLYKRFSRSWWNS